MDLVLVRRPSSRSLSLIEEVEQQQQTPPPQPQLQQETNKLLNVTVTIISLNGIHAKETTPSKSLFSNKHTRGRSPTPIRRTRSRSPFQLRSSKQRRQRRSLTRSLSRSSRSPSRNKKNRNSRGRSARKPNHEDETTIMATFERVSVTKKSKRPSRKVSHVSSLPLVIPPAPKCYNCSNIDAGTFNDIVHWPEENKMASFSFQRQFPIEQNLTNGTTTITSSSATITDTTTTTNTTATTTTTTTTTKQRYVPQLIPIQISLSRPDGRIHKLGNASVFVSGEEDGQISTNVPLITDVASKYSRSGGSSNCNANNGVSLMKIKGDSLRCGVAERATLRVMVRVEDPTLKRERGGVEEPMEKAEEGKMEEEACCWSHFCCF